MKNSDSGTWISDALASEYRAREAMAQPGGVGFAIQGLLPATGVSMWFGPGSTGKTQMLLWMAAHLASRKENGPSHWLNSEIQKRGHILVLSAEDLREDIFLRLGGIARAMKSDHPDLDCEDLCDRIHVLPFLSLQEHEFKPGNPSLFEGRRNGWRPSATMKGIEDFIDAWNASIDDDDDRIIGVIMDSAVSMAGFELSDSEATTEFLFRVNRVSHRQKVFWAIVGHTPKGAAIKDEDPLSGAVDRLRGSAMWSTTPRTVVELRLAGETEKLADVQRAYPDIGRRDIVIAAVVKANSKHADFKPRVLRRLSEGAYQDLTDDFPEVCRAWDPTSPSRPSTANYEDRHEAVADLIRNITDGGRQGATFTREQLEAEFKEKASSFPALAGVIGDASRAKAKSRDYLAYSIRALDQQNIISVQRTGPILVTNLAASTAEERAQAA